MRTLIQVVVLTSLALLTVTSSLACDDVGHKTTAYVARQQMSPVARESIIRILRSAPEDSALSAYYMQNGAEPEALRKLQYFLLVSTWSDIVRERSFENRYKKYHKGNWHYDDTFWKQVGGKAEVMPGSDEGGVAVERLIEFDKVMRNASASDKDKSIAIAWVAHLVGDIHQPLHTSARVTDLEPKGDQGGNLFLLTAQGTPREQQVNLHWFWDSIIGRNIPLKGETCERDYITSIARRITKKYPVSSMNPVLKLGKYQEWRDESFALNPTEVYSPDLIRFQTPSDKYRRKAFAISERQLALAGYRLGATLNQIFTTPSVGPAR